MNRNPSKFVIMGVILFLMSGLVSGCLHRGDAGADIVLQVTPVRVKPIQSGSSVDVIENAQEHGSWPTAVGVFRVERVLKGEFNRAPVGGDSKFEQLKAAGKKKDLLKILTMDTYDPNELRDQEWVSVAVFNPFETFGIKDWENPEGGKGKLYLKRTPGQKDSYILMEYKH